MISKFFTKMIAKYLTSFRIVFSQTDFIGREDSVGLCNGLRQDLRDSFLLGQRQQVFAALQNIHLDRSQNRLEFWK